MTNPHATDSPRTGITVPVVFSQEGRDPLDAVEWDRRRAEIKDEKGTVVWEQDNVEVPKKWSPLATNVVASKYFYGDPKKTRPDGQPEREHSARQLMTRVCNPIAARGDRDGYFATPEDAEVYRKEIMTLCLEQYGSFNSPVWFNMGLYHEYGIQGPANNWIWDEQQQKAVPCTNAYEHPQGSACFIQSVLDDMGGIMALATSEAMLFKYGSGTGSDLSTLRSAKEKVSGGGKASGPVSFMQIYDATASVIKSGGKTRRAAKMQTLKVWHPDILEFIEAKGKEEKKAQVLIKAGYEANFNGEAYSSVKFQNCNMSVRATDEFLRKANGEEQGLWYTRAVTTGEVVDHHGAGTLLDKIAEGTWLCGDPGMQYEDTIQRWHTCPNTAPINSSNPCSEYMFIDDSACNLASINLMKFRREDGTIDDYKLRMACRAYITGQEILVDMGSYPTARIAENSHKFRPLGLGFCNLGSLIMSCGLPYDSGKGRALAAVVSALMHGQAYATSAQHAKNKGPFEGFAENREPMLKVIRMHQEAVEEIPTFDDPELERLKGVARVLWAEVVEAGEKYGFRNSQVTVIAPTGTIAFMMDADTTGIEPDVALIKYKNLAGRGQLKIVNQTVPMALKTLGYHDSHVAMILKYMTEHDTIEGSGIRDEDLPVFDCAFKPLNGKRSIRWQGHVKMMAAVQPFVSGAISKTVNMDREATVEEIREAYIVGWKLGLKALAIYRDGSKWSQPVGTSSDHGGEVTATWQETEEGRAFLSITGHLADFLGGTPALHEIETVMTGVLKKARSAGQPVRRKLPSSREATTHRFEIRSSAGPVEGYITVGFYPGTRTPGEIFITMSKEGSAVSGLIDVIATLVSMGLQYGVPLDVFVKKFAHTRFEPNGFTDNPDIPYAKSVADYIFQWLGMEFIPGYREENAPKRDYPPDHGEGVMPRKLGVATVVSADEIRGVRADMVHPSVIDDDVSDFIPPDTYEKVINGFNGNGHRNGNGMAVLLKGTPKETRNLIEEAWHQPRPQSGAVAHLTGPECPRCSAIMVPNGPCHRCLSCGNDQGGCGG